MTIKSRITGGFCLIILILLIVSAIGFGGIRQLSSNLSFIIGPAWDTADGAMEGTIGIQAEMLAVEKILQGYHFDKEIENLEQGKETANAAIGRLISAGLMQADDIEQLQKVKQQHAHLQDKIISRYQNFAKVKAEFDAHVKQFVALGEEMEEIGDAAVEEFANNPDQFYTWNGAIRQRWLAADGGMESNIGLLWGLYHLSKLIDRSEEFKAAKFNIEQALAFQREASDEMLGTGRFDLSAGAKWNNERYSDLYTKYLSRYESLVETLVQITHEYQQTHDNYIEKSNEFLRILEQFEENGDAAVEGQIGSIQQTQNTTMTVMIIVGTLGIILGVVLAVILIRSILVPLTNILQRVRDIARGEGDLTKRVDLNSKDELGKLAEEFNVFIDHIHSLVIKVGTKRVAMESAMLEMRDVMQDTSQAVAQQESQTDQVATAVTEMAATAKEITQNTQQAADTAQNAAQVGEDAETTVNGAIDTINSLSRELEDATQVIGSLEQDVGQIIGVLDVIGGIAEQTNLLALNAAIEAARAGEQGRGFAVVADEVRGLAGRTQQSTEEIQQMIDRLKNSSRKAVEVMTSSNEKSETTVRQSEEVASALRDIINGVREINDMTQMIATSSEEQAAVSDEMNSSIMQIVDISRDTSSRMRSTSSKCQAALEANAELGSIVGRFKV